MDSSRADQQVLDGFRPWQIQRLRTRLSHYRASKRHGWERIATDILLDEKLPASYVDAEDVRPFSESLRRLDNGSQTPSAERLNAIKTFLISQAMLQQEEIEEKGDATTAPLAFAEFAALTVYGYKSLLAKFASELSGTYFWTEREDHRLHAHELTISLHGSILSVDVSHALYSDPSGQLNNQRHRNRRTKSMIAEHKYSGWAAIFTDRQIVLLMKEKLVESPSATYLLYATEKDVGDGSPARKLLLLPFSGVQTFTNFDAISLPIPNKPYTSAAELFKSAIPRGFKVFLREDADDRK